MSITRMDLIIYEGADFQQEFDIQSGGVALDLTGADARIDIRPYPDSPTLELASTVDNGRIVFTSPEEGKITWQIAFADTTAMGFREAWYDLKLLIAGKVYRPCEGMITYSKQVTV